MELGQSGGKRSGSGKLSFSSEKFCKANQNDFYSFYTSRIKSSIADIALEAWKACISTTQKNVFFIEYEESEDANGVTGFLYRKITDGTTDFVITDMKVQPFSAEVQCYVNGEVIVKGKVNVSMDSSRESFTCDKPDNINVKVGFGTNIGDPIFINMHSKKSIKKSSIDELKERIAVLNDHVSIIEDNIEIIPSLSSDLKNLKTKPKILASLRVKNGNLVSHTGGVSFKSSTGVVTFPNPKNLKVFPVISNYNESTYITETHFIRSEISKKSFKIWRSPLDTGARNSPPINFSAVIIGI